MESHTHRLTVANCIKFVSQTLYFSGPAAAHGMKFITQTLYFSGPAAAHGMKFIIQPSNFRKVQICDQSLFPSRKRVRRKQQAA
jgi:hypothetical protein